MIHLPVYRQLDDHSCGFLAVLAVLGYYAPHILAGEVLRIVRPSEEGGCCQEMVVRSLEHFGVAAAYRESLGPRRLHRLASRGVPVIVTVWPEDWCCDHWTVIRGVDLNRKRVFLTNYEGAGADGGVPWAEFEAVWFPRGGGLVCEARGK